MNNSGQHKHIGSIGDKVKPNTLVFAITPGYNYNHVNDAEKVLGENHYDQDWGIGLEPGCENTPRLAFVFSDANAHYGDGATQILYVGLDELKAMVTAAEQFIGGTE